MLKARPPRNKKKLQSLISKVNFQRMFIANSARKMKVFSPLLKLKLVEEFIWGAEKQKTFDQIKESLASPPILTPPALGRHLKLYILASDDSIGSLLAQDDKDGTKRAICYLS